jgi:prepilin-type N-terminal cleavage/methylation domain-containing protein
MTTGTCHRRGFSLIEMMATVALLTLILYAGVNYLPQLMSFFRVMTVNQSVNLDSRRCVDTLSQVLAKAQSGTVSISSQGPGTPPYSNITFAGNDGSSYQIYWSNVPVNSVHLVRTWPGSTIGNDSVIAVNVTSLMFFLSDFRDAAVIHFTVQMSAPYTAMDAFRPGRAASSLIANQTVQTVSRQ